MGCRCSIRYFDIPWLDDLVGIREGGRDRVLVDTREHLRREVRACVRAKLVRILADLLDGCLVVVLREGTLDRIEAVTRCEKEAVLSAFFDRSSYCRELLSELRMIFFVDSCFHIHIGGCSFDLLELLRPLCSRFLRGTDREGKVVRKHENEDQEGRYNPIYAFLHTHEVRKRVQRTQQKSHPVTKPNGS